MKFQRIALLGALVAGLSAFSASAETLLRMATALPDNHLYVEHIYQPYIDKANEVGKGEYTIQHFPPPFATNTNVLDRVVSGVADIGVIQMPAVGIPFPRTDVIGLPNLTTSSEAAMAALWGLYEDKMLDAALDDQFVLLGFVTATAPRLFTKFPVKTAEDLKARRIRINGRTASDVIQELGGTPVSISITETYQALDRGVAEGLTTAINAVAAFNFQEVVSHGIENYGFGLVPGAVIMNKASFEKLSPEGRAALMSVSGLELSKFIGRQMDMIDEMSRDVFEGKIEMTNLSDEELARWMEATEKAIQNWVNETDNGAAILASYKERLAAFGAAK